MQKRHTDSGAAPRSRRWPALRGARAAVLASLAACLVVLLAARPAQAVDRCLAVAQAPSAPAAPMRAGQAAAITSDGRVNRIVGAGGWDRAMLHRMAGGVGEPLRLPVMPMQGRTSEVTITYWGHSTFVLESPAGVRIATDYNDYIKPSPLPHVVTMNRAHSSHYTDLPEAGITHVLRGWNPSGGQAMHDITERDIRVRNVATNIRTWEGGGHIPYGNSIFVFEVAGLCIAHLGHLHHTLTPQQLGQIGQMDVVLVPVDGSYTLDLDGMVEVLQALRAPLMLPMHYFSRYTLGRFLDRVRGTFEIEEASLPMLVVTRATLPKTQTVRVLPAP